MQYSDDDDDDGGGEEDVELGVGWRKRPRRRPPSLAAKVGAAARSVVCCALQPVKVVAVGIAVVLLAVLAIIIGLYFALKQTPDGATLVQTMTDWVVARSEDQLLTWLDSISSGQLGTALVRMPFNTVPMGTSVFTAASGTTVQGWIEPRRNSIRYAVTVQGIAPSAFRGLIVARRTANQSIAVHTLASGTFQTNEITGQLQCADDNPACQQLFAGRLAGDRISVVLLSKEPTNTFDGLPPPGDILKEARVT